jgi:hypothetical protein
VPLTLKGGGARNTVLPAKGGDAGASQLPADDDDGAADDEDGPIKEVRWFMVEGLRAYVGASLVGLSADILMNLVNAFLSRVSYVSWEGPPTPSPTP